MNNSENTTIYSKEEEEKIDFKKIVFLLRRQWQWLLLFGTLGIIGAYGYIKFNKFFYIVSTSIIIPEKSNGLNMQELF